MWIKHCSYFGRSELKGNTTDLGEFIILWVGWRLNFFLIFFLTVSFIYLFISGSAGSLLLSELFSSCSNRGATPWLWWRTSHCGSSSGCGQGLWGVGASGALTRGLRSCDVWAVERMLSSGGAGLVVGSSWSEVEPMSPALRGRFLTTEAPGKPFLIVSCEFSGSYSQHAL